MNSRRFQAPESQSAEGLELAVKSVFSWVVLMPIAVIVSGKLLAQHMKLGPTSVQLFRIAVFKTLRVEANNDEVILGFTGFILTLLVVGLTGGRGAYDLFTSRFGVDPGHFNALCVLSSFLLVVWSFGLFLIRRLAEGMRSGRLQDEHSGLIDGLARRGHDD